MMAWIQKHSIHPLQAIVVALLLVLLLPHTISAQSEFSYYTLNVTWLNYAKHQHTDTTGIPQVPTNNAYLLYTSEDHLNISANDSRYNSWKASAQTSYSDLLYHFQIKEPSNTINRINVTWIGYPSGPTYHTLNLFVWNFTNSSWFNLLSDSSAYPSYHSYESNLSGGFSDFISLSGSMFIAVAIQSGSFTEDTRVSLFDGGYASVKDITVGESIKGYDLSNHEIVDGTVTEKIRYEADEELYRIQVDDIVVNATANHIFYVVGVGYVPAHSMSVGDEVIDSNNTVRSITDITTFHHKGYVYDIETTTNNFFANDILVHNAPAATTIYENYVEVVVEYAALTDTLAKTYGGSAADLGYSLAPLSDGGFALFGTTITYGAGSHDFWLLRVNSSGDVLLNQTYGSSSADYVKSSRSMAALSDDTFALLGYNNVYGAGNYDYWLLKVNSSGDVLLNKTYGGSGNDYAWAVAPSPDSGLALFGYSTSYGAGGNDFWLLRVNPTGTVLLNETYGGGGSELGYNMAPLSDGSFALGGGTTSYGAGSYDFWFLHVNSSGGVLLNLTFGGTGSDILRSVLPLPDGGFALLGSTTSYGTGNNDFWILRINSSGDVLLNQTYGGSASDIPYSLNALSDGYVLGGQTLSYGGGRGDFWLLRIYESAETILNLTFGETDPDTGYSIVPLSADGFALLGFTQSVGSGSNDMLLLRINSTGQFTYPSLSYTSWALADVGYPADPDKLKGNAQLLTGLSNHMFITADDQYLISSTNLNNYYEMVAFQIVNTTPVVALNFTWEGYDTLTLGGSGVTLSFWNLTNDYWQNFSSSPDATEITLNHYFDSRFQDMFNDSIMWILAKSNGKYTIAKCPFLYSWDGSDYVFDGEPLLWRGLPQWEGDVSVRLRKLKADGDKYKVKIAEEYNEIVYLDKLRLAIVDHPPGTKVYADTANNYYTIRDPIKSISCYDEYKKSCLDLVGEKDDIRWNMRFDNRKNIADYDGDGFTDSVEDSDLFSYIELEFERKGDYAKIIHNLKKSAPAVILWQKELKLIGDNNLDVLGELSKDGTLMDSYYGIYPTLSVWDGTGWINPYLALEVFDSTNGQDIVHVIDLTGINTPTLKIRYSSGVGLGGLDYVWVDYSSDEPITVTLLEPAYASFNIKDELQRGSELKKLMEDDSKYLVFDTGDYGFVEFDAIPTRTEESCSTYWKPGSEMERTFFLDSNGYYYYDKWENEVDMTEEKRQEIDYIFSDPLVHMSWLAQQIFNEDNHYTMFVDHTNASITGYCDVPSSGDWSIPLECILHYKGTLTVPASLFLQNGGTLLLNNTELHFATPGSKIVTSSGGKLIQSFPTAGGATGARVYLIKTTTTQPAGD